MTTAVAVLPRFNALPVLSGENGLARYLLQIKQFPMLAEDEEFRLGKRWKEDGDVEAAHRLVTSHLRLVAKIAMGYRGYGLPLSDLISEGNVGMMQAVRRFDPDKGFRLATYAMWWIKASIQEYILHSWSLVKIGTTAGQKKLFFNLRKLKGKIRAAEEGDLTPEQVQHIATTLDVTTAEVVSMNKRMTSPDYSLNARIGDDSQAEWQDWLEDERDNQEMVIVEKQERANRAALLSQAMQVLNDREKRVLAARRMSEIPLTLEDLSQELGISRERVRQIEVKAFEKVQKSVLSSSI
ncbi:MAG: RNA polymerase sigma factor RpoH [Alphaproteobacteria bacterium]